MHGPVGAQALTDTTLKKGRKQKEKTNVNLYLRSFIIKCTSTFFKKNFYQVFLRCVQEICILFVYYIMRRGELNVVRIRIA
jgi:hypothetical protein